MNSPRTPKIIALFVSLALAGAYVAYRVVGATGGSTAPSTTPGDSAPSSAAGDGPPSVDVMAPALGTVEMLGGSKSLAPLVRPRDVQPAPEQAPSK